MQLFSILLLTANFIVSALAAPICPAAPNIAKPTNVKSSCTPDFHCGTQVGQGTFFAPDRGACGSVNTPSQFIVAVSFELFDAYPGYAVSGTNQTKNPNSNPVCGRKIRANYNGKSVDVTVVDRCTGCKETDLDFSPAAFDQLADESVGRLSGMTWTWAS